MKSIRYSWIVNIAASTKVRYVYLPNSLPTAKSLKLAKVSPVIDKPNVYK